MAGPPWDFSRPAALAPHSECLNSRTSWEREIALASYACIVIGASSGGVRILQELAAALPADIPAAIFVVQHIGRYPSRLPEMLERCGPLPACHAQHLQLIEPRRIYVAPPDHHLTLARTHVWLSRGPRENWARPAIDPLFRSAGAVFDGTAVGVILSGGLNDGTAGLRALRASGGKAVVQDPKDASFAEMPASALRYAGADHCVRLKQMAPLLVELSRAIVAMPEEEPSDRWRTPP
jgi:two-component system chemotaxis response regulator CheB